MHPVLVPPALQLLEVAIDAALEKLERAIEHKLGKVAITATGRRTGKG